MPFYQYVDNNGHAREVWHSMSADPVITCLECCATMHRKPQVTAVNWNGLPPHLAGTRSPEIQAFLSDTERRREEYEATKDTNPFNEFHK